MPTFLSNERFSPMYHLFRSLLGIYLQGRKLMTSGPIVAFCFPFVFCNRKREKRIAFMVVNVIVYTWQKAVFTLLRFQFFCLSSTLAKYIGCFSQRLLWKARRVTFASRMYDVRSFAIGGRGHTTFFFSELHR